MELVATPSARNMRAVFERIFEIIPVSSGSQTDNGSEGRGVFEELLQERGIAMQIIQPRRPKQNGASSGTSATCTRKLYETSFVAATLDACRCDARFTTTMSGPMPHLAE